MALVSCPECEQRVSTEAAACPGCGYPLGKRSEQAEIANVVPVAVERQNVDADAPARRSEWRTLIAGVLVLSLIIGSVYVVAAYKRYRRRAEAEDLNARYERELERSRERQREVERARANVNYYCFSSRSADENITPCWQGHDNCERRRAEHLDNMRGANVSDCAHEAQVYEFTFTCPGNSESTCYIARDTRDDCERAHAKQVGKANNLTDCNVTSPPR